jgi:ADP-ribose pyrophosphatase YjhB (NUDIX family)
MAKPITPLCGCDVFAVNDKNEVLLVQRSDNGFWCLPGGCHDLNETPKNCAARECLEESGYAVEITNLIGVYSSNCYPYINYPWKENQFCHLLFTANVIGGSAKTSSESLNVGWFAENQLPPLSDGHLPRIQHGYQWIKGLRTTAYFE